jgi:hypothetical protein
LVADLKIVDAMERVKPTKERSMEIWWILGFIAVWIILQAWVLPKLGVRT